MMEKLLQIPWEKTVDFSKKFIPEAFTPLYYTPYYQTLSEAQKLSYNQLHALYINEQTIFFELYIANIFLPALLKQTTLPLTFQQGIQQFIEEEHRHTQMFRQLNQLCAPHLYTSQDFQFIQLSKWAKTLLRTTASHTRWFPLYIWLMFFQEEKSVQFSKEWCKPENDIEIHFVRAHKLHLADEISHVQWDQALSELIWTKTPQKTRQWNAKFLRWMLMEFFYLPKRAGIRVIHEWLKQFPTQQSDLPSILLQIKNLKENIRLKKEIYFPKSEGGIIMELKKWPEFSNLVQDLSK